MKLLVTDYDNTYELHYDNMDLDKIFYENQKALGIFQQNNIVALATVLLLRKRLPGISS